MNNLTYENIRGKYLDFFVNRNHKEIPSAPLVPEDDPSVLFVNSGMFPLVPFLKGQRHPEGNRLTNSQRCVRTGDIDEVGDATHCTTFEMLGNWSLNDYFKKEAIEMTVQFFVEELGLDINRIYASVFEGEGDIPRDEVSIAVWEEIFSKYGIDAKVGKEERIMPLGREDNWWGLPSGGPCGPDSELFYKTDSGELVEIGNNVFMEYLLEDGIYKPLGRHNVDFGGGLDRLVSVCQGVNSVYEVDIYRPIFEKVKTLSKSEDLKSQRIITDHLKAATWIVMDGVLPSNTQQGYILRRLIRRAVRHGRKLEIDREFTREVADVAIEQFKNVWPQLIEKRDFILKTIEDEERKFNKTVEHGLKELEKTLSTIGHINGEKAFQLYETYGLPLEVIEEILKEKELEIINKESFTEAQSKHQEKSRTSSAGMFKGGLADSSEMTTRYHTATHLLLEALRKTLGDHVYQKGSNITSERLRLDFPSDEKLTQEQIEKVEKYVNDAINKSLDVNFEEVSKQEALERVPFAAFEERYGDIVKLYYVGEKENPYSLEICNGPHVSNTRELGKFKIVKQENVGAGIKRIKAILE
ncbi:MAG: alanine--tRNA ligase [Candidatus Dojkabacteria bacterium]|jgi:alanyl-tRNA synthetase|nr:alanine--tRNA ligase [Candidatus Dojkabacteria bacterium]